MSISKEFIVQLQGRDFCLFAGLLDAATRDGLRSIATDVVQIPTAENGRMAVVQATVEFEGGRTFQGTGDASPESVGRMILPHLLRMAETRAIGRALRWALNVAVAMKEELGGDEEAHNGHQNAPQPRPAVQRARHDPEDHAARKAAQEAAQEAAQAMCEVCGTEVPAPVATAARKRWGTVLCVVHGRERMQQDKETPAQMQGA